MRPVLAALVALPARMIVAQTAASDTVGARWEYDALSGRYVAEVIATGFRVPFGLAFLPDGRAVVSDRPTGQLALLDPRTRRVSRIEGTPAVFDSVDAGMLDVAVHPDFARNYLLYYAFAEDSDTGRTTVVERARLRDGRLVDRQRLFAAYPALQTVNHFGARLLLLDGYLYVTLGERDIRELAQELWTHHGKIVRLHDDGRVPRDNPLVGQAGARPEIWSYGHRNPHGLAIRPGTSELWSTEHGPLGGDEINVIQRGANYGWPLATYGREYQGHPIPGAREEIPGMVSPVHRYAISAALSGLMFYTGDRFPQWRGSLFVGAMTPRYLGRVTVDSGRVREERLLLEKRWRVRVLQQGPDGFIYLGIERSARNTTDGKIVRLRPVASP